jgi:SAM-dependent methyltransferase
LTGFQAPAEAYDRYIGRYAASLAEELLRVAEVRPGQRALDVGCGPGGLTGALAGVLGADQVAAVEPSTSFADACRRRVPGADVREAPAETLPFDDDGFDVALSQLVVNFMTDPLRGVSEMARVVRPGGVVASCVWDYAEGMTLLRRFWDAAGRVDPDGAAEHDEGRVMRHCSTAELEELWSNAGLVEIRSGELAASAHYESFDSLWAPLELGVGPSGAYAMSLQADRRAALRDELRALLGDPPGDFTLSARAWYVKGLVS